MRLSVAERRRDNRPRDDAHFSSRARCRPIQVAGTYRVRSRIYAHQCWKNQKVGTACQYRRKDCRRTRCQIGREAREDLIMDVEKGTRQLKALIEKLERNNRTLRSHPTIEKIERGELSKSQLRYWATQLFIGNKAHNANILGLIYAKCDDFPARKAIVENLIEEELGRISGANR